MDYVKYVRSMVGNNKIIMNASAVIIHNDKQEILLQLRGDDHFWGLPGGIMEMDELPEETAKREVLEETGYIIEIDSYLGAFHNFNKVWPSNDVAHIICFVYTGKIIGGSQYCDGLETLELKWFSKDNLPKIDALDHFNAIQAFYNKN